MFVSLLLFGKRLFNYAVNFVGNIINRTHIFTVGATNYIPAKILGGKKCAIITMLELVDVLFMNILFSLVTEITLAHQSL